MFEGFKSRSGIIMRDSNPCMQGSCLRGLAPGKGDILLIAVFRTFFKGTRRKKTGGRYTLEPATCIDIQGVALPGAAGGVQWSEEYKSEKIEGLWPVVCGGVMAAQGENFKGFGAMVVVVVVGDGRCITRVCSGAI